MNPPEAFVFHNGRRARTAGDLLLILEEGPSSLYNDHVAGERNDFATWAELALGEHTLATRLREARTRDEAVTSIRHWLEPHRQRRAAEHHGSRADFFLGLAIGLILGLLLMGVVQLIG